MRRRGQFKPSRIPGLALWLDACQGITAVDIPAWVTSTVYAVGTRVVQSATYYQCAIAHTSGTFATDLAAVKWVATTDGATQVCSAWADQTTNARNASQATADYRPAYVTNVLNGRPVLRFDGVDDSLFTTALTNLNSLVGLSVFVVVSPLRTTGTQITAMLRSTEGISAGIQLGTDLLYIYYSDENGMCYGHYTATHTIGVPKIYTSIFNGALSGNSRTVVYEGGTSKTLIYDISPPADLCNTLTSLYVGKGTGADAFQGDIAEIIIYPTALSDNQRKQVELYLSRKWDIAVTV